MPSQKSLVRDRIKRALKELERGKPAAARPLLEQAVAIDSTDGFALGYLGTALLQLGDVAHAVARLEQARSRLRDEAWVVGNLGEAYSRAGDHDGALDAFQTAARLDPANLTFSLGFATSLGVQGRHDEAAEHIEELLRRSPAHPLLWFNLGNVRRQQGRLDDARRCFQYAVEAEPGWTDARNSLGSALHALLRFDEAEQTYRDCIDAQPARTDFRLNLASLLIDTGRHGDAEALCRQLVQSAPDLLIARRFLASALVHQGKLIQAEQEERAAADLAPENAQIAGDLACTLAQIGRMEEAWSAFDHALRLQPQAGYLRTARAGALLADGRLKQGWAEYAERSDAKRFPITYPGRDRRTELPRFGGDELEPLVLVAEQGLGDELFFLRFARALAHARLQPQYVSSSKLRPLLRHAETVAAFVPLEAVAPDAALMLIGDLPGALSALDSSTEPGAAHTRASEPYPAPLRFQAAAHLRERMRQRLQASGPPPYIALTWRGGIPPHEQRHEWLLYKSIDPGALGETLRALPGTLVSIQRNPIGDEYERLRLAASRDLHDYSDLNDDLEAMLALLEIADDYVGVSNTNMHIRAGTGRGARVLIPGPAEWRWAGSGERSLWFPEFRCYRQALDGDWHSALASLRADLLAAMR